MIEIRTSAHGGAVTHGTIEYEKFLFSGGEIQVKLKPLKVANYITSDDWVVYDVKIQSPSDIIELFLLDDAIQEQYGYKSRSLFMSYLPYARQDRVCDKGEALSIRVFANLINSLNFDWVRIVDAHSDVGPALIKNCENVPVEDILSKHLADEILGKNADQYVYLVSPDAGADKKVLRVSQKLGGVPIIKADKVRDVKTGNITHTAVHCDDLVGNDCFIVDDVIDGGRTFIELAKKLKEKNAGKISLYATHGIFSKGLGVFDGLIDEIYTTDSFNSDGNITPAEKERLHIIKV
jgi:ribose-phosphate pyrophosphokinase